MYRVVTDPIEALKISGSALKFFKNQTEEMQLAAIKSGGSSYEDFKNPSEKVRVAMVKNNPSLLRFMEDQTEEIQLAAVKRNGFMLGYAKNPSEKVKLAAIKEYGDAIRFITDPSEELKAIAAAAETADRERNVLKETHVVKLEDKIFVGGLLKTKEEWLKTTEKEIEAERSGGKYAKLLKSIQEIVKEL